MMGLEDTESKVGRYTVQNLAPLLDAPQQRLCCVANRIMSPSLC